MKEAVCLPAANYFKEMLNVETSMVDGLLILKLNSVQTIVLAVITYYFGVFVRSKIYILRRLSVPSPVIGGLLFATFACILRSQEIVGFDLDKTLQTSLMIIFFSTIGIGASLFLIKKGGKTLIIFFSLAVMVAFMQNTIGIILAKLTGVHAVLGIVGGAVTLMGGLGTAGAFGPYFENLGVSGATTAAIACATFGMVAGSLMGGPFGEGLIKKYKLSTKKDEAKSVSSGSAIAETPEDENSSASSSDLMKTLGFILIAMALGAVLSSYFSDLGMTLPIYIGAMMAAAIVRNIGDFSKLYEINMDAVDIISNISLALYLTMAINGLKLWELANLAFPLMVILAGQIIFIAVFAWRIVFFVMGRDYEAVQMSVGMIGFGLGAMPNALANMASLSEKYGYAPQAYLLVSLVGAFLIDFVNALLITWMGSLFL